MMISHPSPLHVDVSALGAVAVLSVDGILDSTTYRPLRDSITKSALDLPVAVIVDVSSLRIPTASACAVFSSARWQVSRWPDVPVLLACSDPARRELLVQNGIGRYVPIYPDVDTAADSVGIHMRERIRRRARVELLRSRRSVEEAKAFVAECLAEWSLGEQTTAAKMVVTELVRNALTHTDSAPSLLVESRGALVTIAVEDGSTRVATLPETTFSRPVTGLELVAGLSRAWGTVPSSTGKTVWATIEPQ